MSTGGGVFNIGNQQAGAIFQAAGDQTIEHGGGALTIGVMDAVANLRAALGAETLPAETSHEVEQALSEVEAEVAQATPDKGRVAGHLESLIGILGPAGTLASAGEALAGPLRSIAAWAGVAGQTALRLLA